MVTKAELHRLIDELPEPAVPAAARLLAADASDPTAREVISDEELKRELRL